MTKLDYCTKHSRSRSQRRFKMSMSTCPKDVFRGLHSVAKLSIVNHHHGPECHVKMSVCYLHYLQGQGRN